MSDKQQDKDTLIKGQLEELRYLRSRIDDLEEEAFSQRYDRRFQLAKAAMQGMISAITTIDHYNNIILNRPQSVAELSVLYADTLLSELNK
jgi:hypothetical protein